MEKQCDEDLPKTWTEYRIRLPIVLIALLLQSLLIGGLMLIIALKHDTPQPIGRTLHDSAGNYCMCGPMRNGPRAGGVLTMAYQFRQLKL